MEQPAEALSTLLSYNQKRMRAMSSRSYRVISPSTNTSSATCGQTIEFRIPGNQSSSFLDNSTMYFRVNVANNNGAAINLEGKGGAYSLFMKKITISTAGQTISEVNEFGILHSCFVDTDSDTTYGANTAKVLFGASDTGVGQAIAAGASATFVLPNILNNLANSRKYIPLFGRDAITIRIETNSALLGCVGGATDAEITFSDLNLIYNVIELSAPAMTAVAESVGNEFTIVSDDYRHTSATVSASANQTLVANLGFAFSSVNRILIAQQNTARLLADKVCVGNRCRRDLEEVNLLLNGEQLPARPIKVSDQGSEALAETLIADRSLVAYDHDSRIAVGAGYTAQDPTGADSANTGSFLVEIDTESMRSPMDESFGGLYSGLSSIGSVFQAQLKYGSTAPSGSVQVHFWAQYTSLLTLNMNTNQQFLVAV